MSLPPPVPAAELARRLDISEEAVALMRRHPTYDLHLDSFIPTRLFGYDLRRRHRGGPLGGRFFGHLDFARARDAGLAGGMWSITTNPVVPARMRWNRFRENLRRFRRIVAEAGPELRLVRSHAEALAAREAGAHAVLLAIQGGNALQAAPEGPLSIPERLITRITLVHLTNSVYGPTSSPLALWRKDDGLSAAGKDYVARMDAARIFVDLAHINRPAFWDAVDVHDKTLPLLVTHTGVCGVTPHWRNLDDAQVKAIADSGGVIGIIFEPTFLRRKGGPDSGEMIVEHMQHIIDLVGDAHVAFGSDYDGAIRPPRELRDGVAYPRLVQRMLDRGWDEERIARILGGNFLRAFARLRP